MDAKVRNSASAERELVIRRSFNAARELVFRAWTEPQLLAQWSCPRGFSFTAQSGKILRRNAVLMPFYTITMPLVFIVGFTAVLVLPGLGNGDLAMLAIVRKTFPAWLPAGTFS